MLIRKSRAALFQGLLKSTPTTSFGSRTISDAQIAAAIDTG